MTMKKITTPSQLSAGNLLALGKEYASIITTSVKFSPDLLILGSKKITKNRQNQAADYEDTQIIQIAHQWIQNNNNNLDRLMPHKDWRIRLPDNLKADGQYLMICNHQSWVDTTVIQYVSTERLPLTRFFTKQELLYLPIVGQVFYLLDFPMMKRHKSKDTKQDLNEAYRACRLLSNKPFVLLNYLEGTRNTPAKHANQQSPYRHLLKPKAGGLALAISALGDKIDGILDMTIAYPNGTPSYHDLWLGKVDKLSVDIRYLSMPDELFVKLKAGYYLSDDKVKQQFYAFLDKIWQQKDERLETMLNDFYSQ